MADRSPPDRLNLASFKQRNSAITQDLERQEVERENLWKRLQAARAEGDQLRALEQRSTDEDLSASSAASSPRAIATKGFVCPACFMRAPTQEVLQSHWEAVHQTNSDRFFDGARAAFRRVKRSMSQRPASSKAAETAPPPPIRKAAVARRHTWEMELVKWRQHALV